jgi:hypothetical protein
MMEKLRTQKKLLVPSILFFLTIADNLNFLQEVSVDAISFLREVFPIKFPGIKTIPTTDTEIKNIIHSLKAKNWWNNK